MNLSENPKLRFKRMKRLKRIKTPAGLSLAIILLMLFVLTVYNGCTLLPDNETTAALTNDDFTETEAVAKTTEETSETLYSSESSELKSELLFETTTKINDNVPDLIFSGYGNMGYYDGNYQYYRLTVVNSKSKEIINDFYLPDYTLEGETISAENFDIEFLDVNFDGNKDICIFNRPNGNWNLHYIYFIWDENINAFSEDTQLRGLGLPVFDEEKQLIYSMARSGGGQSLGLHA